MRYQPIYDIAEICARKNVTEVVLCPGSRCAPLTLAFTRHPGITTRTFSDERSAGFIALGIAQSIRRPVVVVCTSGTAVYNLAPAIAEAFFSHTPLVVITADRPGEWIAQHDGQTIYQSEVFGKHVKKYFELPQDYEHPDSVWAINRMANEALNLSLQKPCGPIHINAPFREPLYPSKGEDTISFTKNVREIREHFGVSHLPTPMKQRLAREWAGFDKVLLVGGQHVRDARLTSAVRTFRDKHHVPVVHDVISNLHEVGSTIGHSDLFLGQASENHREMLRPDLLITFGHSLISKNLKIFLRKYPAIKHWHIQHQGPVADTFKTVTDVFFSDPHAFIDFLSSLEVKESFELQKQKNYGGLWEIEERRTVRLLDEFFEDAQLSELAVVKALLERVPEGSNVHLANSMSVRYANFIGLQQDTKEVSVFANRGTSGIDGSTSTAVGHALSSPKMNILITGDLAFFYDRNAFWHNYSLPNLRVLLLNNHGGLIFDVLDGPSSMPEAREYFITRQGLTARKLCEEFGIEHLRLDNARKIKNLLSDFLSPEPGPKVLEVEGDTGTNKVVFERLKSQIKQSYEL
jgi:2-succinyl-5-enolpyruvyl-6-hydroxy-3-cyclohexene-1-carboxylate synthase